MRFSFDNNRHEYIDVDAGEILPHITGMLKRTGWSDDRFYTDASRDRGTAVHRLTADYDLGSIENLADLTSNYKGWLLAHVKMSSIIRPTWTSIEEARVHHRYRYGGRPDRVGFIYGALAVPDVKSGPAERGHQIQTALQAILVAPETNLPPEAIQRYGWYLKGNGKYKLEHFVDRRDFDEAYRIIRECCEVAA